MDAPRTQTLLLVDDEPNIISALQRVLRRDGYTILACDGPEKALALLATHPVDVVLSDQRMPSMSGVEFLRRVRQTHPETVRIVLSGYADLQFITDAINEGAIYKFLTKPWDDDQLRQQIREAFRSKEIADENQRLTQALRASNAELQNLAAERERQAKQVESALRTLQEVIQLIPWPIVGVDETGMIALANTAADNSLSGDGYPLLGRSVQVALPAEMRDWFRMPAAIPERVVHAGRDYRVVNNPMGERSDARGTLLALLPGEEP